MNTFESKRVEYKEEVELDDTQVKQNSVAFMNVAKISLIKAQRNKNGDILNITTLIDGKRERYFREDWVTSIYKEYDVTTKHSTKTKRINIRTEKEEVVKERSEEMVEKLTLNEDAQKFWDFLCNLVETNSKLSQIERAKNIEGAATEVVAPAVTNTPANVA